MTWKKNLFSYFVWFVYALAVGLGMACVGSVVCDYADIPFYVGIALGIAWVFLVGGAVFLLHRRRASGGRTQRESAMGTVAEAAIVVIVLAAGLVLRVYGIDGAGEKAAYFQAASVMSGQEIPQVVQGSVYLYLQLLHVVFYFLGNKLMAGVWLQILLQFTAVLLLYFAVRCFAGRAGSMIFLCFCMFSSFMVEEALNLSPEMLYLGIWSGVLLWLVTATGRRFRVPEYFFTGLLVAVPCYLDVAGTFLFFAAASVLFCRRDEEEQRGRMVQAGFLCVLGFLLGFLSCVLADAVCSGKTFVGVLGAWMTLYRPERFSVPLATGEAQFPAEFILLLCLLVFGVFGFWRDRENDRMKGWVAGLCAMALLSCFGCFTALMPVGVYLFLLMLALAALGVDECFRRIEPVREEDAEPEEQGTEELVFVRLPEVPRRREPPPAPGMIENPLPLPKRHVSRVLDYDIKSVDSSVYDLETDDNDDFDL